MFHLQYAIKFIRAGTLVSIALVFTILTSFSVSAESWPTTKFEAFEGVPWNSNKPVVLEAGKALHNITARDNLWEMDEARPAYVPLTPELKYEIEEYLAAVAQEYQKHFTDPRLEPIVTRDDGAQAYRIYYYDIPGPDPALARYGNDCSDSIRFRIEVNASSHTRGGKITPKGYGDLAHELFHAVQRNTTAGKKFCDPDTSSHWIIEGQAEAVGHDMARQLRRVEVNTQISRWGLRHYSKPLVIPAGGPVSRGYQTSSFWRYIAEMHYLRSRGKRDVEAKPGPDLPGDYDTDYSYLADLLNTAPGSGQRLEAQWLGDWTNDYFGIDLSRIFIDFVSVFTQYGKYRMDGSNPPWPDASTYWREIGFGGNKNLSTRGCTTVKLDEQNDDAAIRLSLKKLAADCIELDVGDTGTPLGWVLQAIGKDKASLKQLRLAMAGGQQISTSAPLDNIPNASGVVAAWNFLLDPGKKQYLLIANIAKTAQKTVSQDIELRFTLSGRDDNHVSKAKGGSTGKASSQETRPGPAGAKQTRARRKAEMVTAVKGAGTTSWDLDENGGDSRVTLKLRSSSVESMLPGNNASTSALGGLHGQMMEAVNVDMGLLMAALEHEERTPGIEVTITVPGFDYGFTGTINKAKILVSGTNDSAWLRSMSPRPEDPYPPCLYPEPTGTLTIEEFTPYILRGSYSGKLTKGGVVRNVRKCPTKDVVDSISGTFVIAAPWTQDDRREVDTSWLVEDAYNDINQMMPAGIMAVDPGLMGGRPVMTADGMEVSGMDIPASGSGELEFQDCDCSCESMQKAIQAVQGGMSGGQPGAGGMQLMMCMGQCMAKIPDDCDLD